MKTEGLKFSDKEIDEMIKFEIESGNPFAEGTYISYKANGKKIKTKKSTLDLTLKENQNLPF
jgi:hypothetical protein